MSAVQYQRPGLPIMVIAARLILFILLIYIAVKSLEPASNFQSIPHMDKLAHALAYGSVMSVSLFALPKHSLSVLIILVAAYGGVIEIAQGIMGNGRTLSGLDALANGAGAILVAVMWVILCRFLRRPKASA